MSMLHKQAFYGAVLPVFFRVRTAVVFKDRAHHQYRTLSGFKMIVELLVSLNLRASPPDICSDILVNDGATDALRSTLRMRLS